MSAVGCESDRGCGKGGAVEDVPLAHLDLTKAVSGHDLVQDDESTDDHRRPRRLEAGHVCALGKRQRGKVFEHAAGDGLCDPVAVDPDRVVLGEAEVDRGDGRDRAGDADRARRS